MFPPPSADAQENRRPPPPIHPRYQSLDKTPLEYRVTRGKNEFAIVVERP